jgi:hypothetical protein
MQSSNDTNNTLKGSNRNRRENWNTPPDSDSTTRAVSPRAFIPARTLTVSRIIMIALRNLNRLTGPLLTSVLAAFTAIPVHAASAPSAPESLAAIERDLAALFEREAEKGVSQHLQSEGRLAHVSVSITIDSANSKITADFGPGFRPYPDEVAAEELLHQLAAKLRYAGDQAGVNVNDVLYLFQGKPLKYYYPEELAVPRQTKASARNATALVSSSHGLIRVFPEMSWEYQRPLAFGFVEDMITPAYGDALQAFLEQRSGLVVSRARSRTVEPHDESTRPWEQMSSRYHLKALLPEHVDIWNSLPDDTNRDREVREDIRARPLYANHLGVGALISLHTNGNDNAAIRGLEVYYHEDKPQDRELAAQVLCSMKELIHAEPGYEEFPARTAPSVGRHGENRIGTMPSVIVEIAYHSNAEDSAALQDPLFRSASMKGVEKGYRLFREGKVCTPFTLAKPQDVSLPAGTNQRLEMDFAGNPQFPVVMEFTLASCSKPGACTPSKTTFSDPDAPIFATMRCLGSATGEARWQVVLRDADGVATKPVEFLQTCRKP